MTIYYSQLQYDLATDPRWDEPEMTEIEYEISMLSADDMAEVEQTADDLDCSIEQAYKELKSIGAI